MFKLFNDTYGHPAGDACLCRVAGAIQSALRRAGDAAYRYGGEEFAVLLPATDAMGVCVVAEAIRSAVAGLGIEHIGSSFGIVTISAGIGWIYPHHGSERASNLLSIADHALYQAKEAGRNRVNVDTAVVGQTTEPVPVGA